MHTLRTMPSLSRWFNICLQVVSVIALLMMQTPRLPESVKGKHCPMATVQFVAHYVREKTCCGKEIVKKVMNPVKASDPDFKQCDCSEKKAVKQQSESSQEGSMLKVVMGVEEHLDMPLCLPQQQHRPIMHLAAHFRDVKTSPLLPPPLV